MGDAYQSVRDFERALCKYTGAPYAVTTTSCSMALLLAVAWWRERDQYHGQDEWHRLYGMPAIELPKRTYIGVPYAIQEAGYRVRFRDEDWAGAYQLKPLPIWDAARWFTSRLYEGKAFCSACAIPHFMGGGHMICVSFHATKTLGHTHGGAILHDDPKADEWLRRARFDGRKEGVPADQDTYPMRRAWHCYMGADVASALHLKLNALPRHNDPLPNDNYPDLSTLEAFK